MTGNALPSDRQARAGRYVRQSTGYRAFILVHKLVEHGILSESTGQKRHRRFRYDAYIRLFDEPEPTPQEIGP